MRDALKRLGYECRRQRVPKPAILWKVIKELDGGVFLVCITGHWVVVSGGKVYDKFYRAWASARGERRRVKYIFKIEKQP